ncbi:MAG: hypothetical protein ABIE22_02680 [archaeon]
MGKKLSLIIFALMLFSSLAAAEVMLSQPKSVYSLGDNIDLQVSLKPVENTDDILKLTLNCENATKDFYLLPLVLGAGETKDIEIGLTLTREFLGGIRGDCFVEARFKNDYETTEKFKISDKIDVTANLDKLDAEAGAQRIVSGTAIKENGAAVEGFVEIKVTGTDVKITRNVQEGKFQANFSLPQSLQAGNYEIEVRVYEKLEDEITNVGTAKIGVNLKQKANKLEIALVSQTVKPGSNVTFKTSIYDQGGNKVSGDVTVKILDSWEDVFYERLVKTEEIVVFPLGNNASAGYWKIEASGTALKSDRLFYVEEYESANFKVWNDTLIVTNVGNVPYRKAIQIAIGNDVEIREVDLDIGESRRFRLLAPEGAYSISVTDGSQTLDLFDVSLTGNVVGVQDIRNQMGAINRYPIVWLFLVVVAGLFLLMMIERVTKKKFRVYAPKDTVNKSMERAGKKSDKIKVREAKMNAGEHTRMPMPGFKEAEHALVHNGSKEKASILNIKIKNMANLVKTRGNAIENITKALENITERKGSIYRSGDHIMGIFTPSVTRTFKNELIATKVAKQIAAELQDHNRKFKDKVEFGIGINSGDIIAKAEKGKLQFTSLGNTVGLSRKVAEIADKDVLLSEEVRNRVMNEIKTELRQHGELKTFEVKEFRDRDEHNRFIRDFLNRVERDRKR